MQPGRDIKIVSVRTQHQMSSAPGAERIDQQALPKLHPRPAEHQHFVGELRCDVQHARPESAMPRTAALRHRKALLAFRDQATAGDGIAVEGVGPQVGYDDPVSFRGKPGRVDVRPFLPLGMRPFPAIMKQAGLPAGNPGRIQRKERQGPGGIIRHYGLPLEQGDVAGMLTRGRIRRPVHHEGAAPGKTSEGILMPPAPRQIGMPPLRRPIADGKQHIKNSLPYL